MRSAEALLAIGMGLGGAVLAVVAARCEAA
jgi:hypothetical protein